MDEDDAARPSGHDDPGDDGDAPDPDDTVETRSMQGQILLEGGSEGVVGLALGAVLAAGSTVWLKLKRRRR